MDHKDLTDAYIIANKNEISFEDLLPKRKLSEEILKELIGYINLRQLIMTQKLSLDFICNYVLNDKYYSDDNETTITVGTICAHQQYSIEEINEYTKKLNL